VISFEFLQQSIALARENSQGSTLSPTATYYSDLSLYDQVVSSVSSCFPPYVISKSEAAFN
jgi:hypothetical protein